MEKEEILAKVISGEIKIYQIENFTKTSKEAVEIRRQAIQKIRKVSLEHIGKYSVNPDNLFGTNIENMIGTVQVPMGIVGPLKINGKYANGEYYVPIVTPFIPMESPVSYINLKKRFLPTRYGTIF